MSGCTSGLPSGVFMRNGNTWFITANEPLSYEPAGSRVVTLSVVPIVRLPLPPEPPSELLSSSLLPPHAVSTRAAAAMPAVVASTRRRLNATEVIRHLSRQEPAPACDAGHRLLSQWGDV